MSGADLRSADLTGADLTGADLRSADLRWANLSAASLSGANFEGVNGSNSILIQPQNCESLVLNEKTNFKDAVCEFIYHVSVVTDDIPTIVKNKRELRPKLRTVFGEQRIGTLRMIEIAVR